MDVILSAEFRLQWDIRIHELRECSENTVEMKAENLFVIEEELLEYQRDFERETAS